jgi:photosystem II stability/assembly factor-like uncharacterized protein
LNTALFSGRFGRSNLQMWRSDDGGAHWRSLQAPFLTGNDRCAVTDIPGSKTTYFAYGRNLSKSLQTPIWVTHDAGDTWMQAFVAQDSPEVSDIMATFASSFMRDGVLYAMHGDFLHPIFSSSADDGATWTPVTPESGAVAPKNRVMRVVPDYAQPHAWYELVSPETGPVSLEHSADDGKTWTVVSQFSQGVGAAPTELATAGLQPNQICGYTYLYDSSATGALIVGDTTMYSSADGGKTWRQAQLPVRDGDVSGMVRAGPDGCYLAFEENVKGGVFGSTYNVSIWRLAPDMLTPERVAYLKDYSLGYSRDSGVSYVAAANGMEARLVVAATRQPRSLLDFFGGNARNLTTPQLLWTPAA